jgi:hypothetical protein
LTNLFESSYVPARDALAIVSHFNLIYAVQVRGGEFYYVQIPRGMYILEDIEAYVARHIEAGLPSFTEPWGTSIKF